MCAFSSGYCPFQRKFGRETTHTRPFPFRHWDTSRPSPLSLSPRRRLRQPATTHPPVHRCTNDGVDQGSFREEPGRPRMSDRGVDLPPLSSKSVDAGSRRARGLYKDDERTGLGTRKRFRSRHQEGLWVPESVLPKHESSFIVIKFRFKRRRKEAVGYWLGPTYLSIRSHCGESVGTISHLDGSPSFVPVPWVSLLTSPTLFESRCPLSLTRAKNVDAG